MKLQYLGHSCFRIISEMGTTIVCDPYDSDMVGLYMAKVRCDVVTMSHHHNDHDCTTHVLGTPAEIDCAISCAADDVAIENYPSFHDEKLGKLRGTNLVFTFLVDGIRVAHLGDIGCRDAKIVQKLSNCDVMLIPVGGNYTIDAEGAKWYVDMVKPKIVIPMHYQVGNSKIDVTGVEQFLQLFEKQDVRNVGDTVVLYDDPQNDTPQVWVMDIWEEE